MKKNIFKSILIIIIIFACLALAGKAHSQQTPQPALTIDALEIQAMARAQTADGLRAQMAKLEQLRTDELACQLQLKNQKLPYSCYDARFLRLNGKWPLTPAFYRDLDSKCARIAAKTTDLDLERNWRLPAKCLTIARRQIQINRYKAGKSWQSF